MTKHQSEYERRAQILEAAREEFVLKGYASARVEDVAKRASLSKGAVYFYFPSKLALFMAVVLREHEATYAFLEAAEADPRPALVKLIDVAWRYLDVVAGGDRPPRINLMMVELATREPEIREECQAIHIRFVEAAARVIAQGIAEGAFRPQDPLAVAQLHKAMVDGFAGQAAIGVEPDRASLLADGFAYLLRGLIRDGIDAEAAAMEAVAAVAAERAAAS